MTPSLVSALVWFVLAHVLAFLPSRDNHWTQASFLIVLGIPLLGWVTMQNGPWVALILLAAGASVLRWPLVYLGRWVRDRTVGNRRA